MKDFKPTIECRICGGECCKRMPAPYTPKDINRIFGGIEKAIKSNMVAIDWWEAVHPLYFMRPKTKQSIALVDPSWGGECIHLKQDGCDLSREQMPSYCKALEPRSNKIKTCTDHLHKHNSKFYAGILWKKSGIDLSEYCER